MEYGEALRELQKYERFFRALKTMGEVLEDVQRAIDDAARAKEEAQNARGEAQNLTSGLAGIREALKKVKGQYEAKTAELEAKYKAREEQLMVETETKIAAKQTILRDLENAITEASVQHEATLESYKAQVEEAKFETKKWDGRLAESRKAFEDFRARLN